MDMVEIVPADLEIDSEDDGSDIDAENLIDEFDEETDEGNDAFERDNAGLPAQNYVAERAPPGPPAGGAARQWTDQLAAVTNVPITGKISLLLYNNRVFNHIHHLEYV
jgi:hypothetical protein